MQALSLHHPPPPHNPQPPLPLSHLYSRFSQPQILHLCHAHPSLDRFVREPHQSYLPLQSLHLSHQSHFPGEAMRLLGRSSMSKTLKTLSCTHFDCLTDDDLYLQRLDLYYYKFGGLQKSITDRGICAISVRLTSLLSMIICVSEDVSNRSFESLSSNCPLLRGLRPRLAAGSAVSLDYFSFFASLSYLDLDNVTISMIVDLLNSQQPI